MEFPAEEIKKAYYKNKQRKINTYIKRLIDTSTDIEAVIIKSRRQKPVYRAKSVIISTQNSIRHSQRSRGSRTPKHPNKSFSSDMDNQELPQNILQEVKNNDSEIKKSQKIKESEISIKSEKRVQPKPKIFHDMCVQVEADEI